MKRLMTNTFVAVVLAASALAQTGFPPYGSFEGGQFEVINRENLNVNFGIPVIGSPGRGFALSHALRYDSLIWRKIGSYWLPVGDAAGNPTMGWKLENVTGSTQFSEIGDGCTTYDGEGFPVYNPYLIYNDYRYVDPQGTIHPFSIEYYTGMGAETCGVAGGTQTGYATDGSGYYIDATNL